MVSIEAGRYISAAVGNWKPIRATSPRGDRILRLVTMEVSVVITTYNRERYVVEAVESVLRQSHDDHELIVVDDGSTDDTQRVLAPYLKRKFLRSNRAPLAGARTKRWPGAGAGGIRLPPRFGRPLPSREAGPSGRGSRCAAGRESGLHGVFGFRRQRTVGGVSLREYHQSAFRRRGITYHSLFGEAQPVKDIPGAEAVLRAEAGCRGRQMYFGDIFDSYLLNIAIIAVSVMFRRSLLETTGLQNARFGLFHDLEFALRLSRGQRAAFLDLPRYPFITTRTRSRPRLGHARNGS